MAHGQVEGYELGPGVSLILILLSLLKYIPCQEFFILLFSLSLASLFFVSQLDYCLNSKTHYISVFKDESYVCVCIFFPLAFSASSTTLLSLYSFMSALLERVIYTFFFISKSSSPVLCATHFMSICILTELFC